MGKKVKVHIIGTHGVPANYGGFETLADYLCQYLGEEFDITVYCNAHKYPERLETYHGATLKYLKLDASGFKGMFYDFFTYLHALTQTDVVVYLSPVGSGVMTPLKYLFGKKVIVNHGGLNEWEREKLSKFQSRWAKFNHRVAATFADLNIGDNNLYKASLKENFNAASVVIRYGGDHVNQIHVLDDRYASKYAFTKERYAVSVSRAQVDTNIHVVLEAFENFTDYKIVLVSNWEVSKYGVHLKEKYKDHPNMILLDAIYDKDELDYIRSNSYVYIHSHSRCGTAPSLVEAMNLRSAIVSFDVPTNRETTHDKASYFHDVDSLKKILDEFKEHEMEENKHKMEEIALNEYTWKEISNRYKRAIYSLVSP